MNFLVLIIFQKTTQGSVVLQATVNTTTFIKNTLFVNNLKSTEVSYNYIYLCSFRSDWLFVTSWLWRHIFLFVIIIFLFLPFPFCTIFYNTTNNNKDSTIYISDYNTVTLNNVLFRKNYGKVRLYHLKNAFFVLFSIMIFTTMGSDM